MTIISRRHAMQLFSASAAAGGLSALGLKDALGQVFTPKGRHIYDDVLTYFRYGPHRTGGPGDIATSRWLAKETKAAGLETTLQRWTLTQFELSERRLNIGRQAIEVFPIWLPNPTPDGGIQAKVVDMDIDDDSKLKGKIAVFESDMPVVNKKSNQPRMIERAAQAGALATICANGGHTDKDGEMLLERKHRLTQNSFKPYNQSQWPIPAATVAFNDYDKLKKAAQNGTKIRLTITGEMKPNTEAFNVIGRLDRGTKPIIVSTPLSGWIDSTGERGGGVALWLDLARWAAKPERTGSYIFNATSGHEIGHIGQDHFIEEYGPKPADIRAWVHLGSGLGSYEWEENEEGFVRRKDSTGVQLLGASDSLWDFVKESFSHLPESTFIPANQAHGELRGAHDAGYTTFGLYGGNIFSHSAFDGPQQVSPILLEQLATGLKAALTKLDNV